MEALFGTYVSCIRIGNDPIIPPLVDETRKQEMQYYRQLAITIENRTKLKDPSSSTSVTTSSSESLPTEKELQSDAIGNARPIDLSALEFDLADVDDSDSLISHEPSDSFTLAEGNGFERSDSFTLTEDNPSGARKRKNSYTLESPSPALLAFMRSLRDKEGSDDKVHDIFANRRTDTDSPRTVLPKKEPIIRRNLWDIHLPLSEPHEPIENSVSVPISTHVSPTKTMKRSCASDDGLTYRDSYLSNEDREYIEKIEQQSAHNDTSTYEDDTPTQCDNDSFAKDFNLLDASFMSRDNDIRRESTFSDCSSVSLNKFMPAYDRKSTGCGEAEQEAFQYFQEQLKLKHRQQLQMLLQEQQREHDILKEQFQKISRTSSCVKSSPSESPSVALVHHTYTKKSPNPNSRRSFILDDVNPVQFPIPESSSSPKKTSGGVDRRMHKAATKIQAGVRGYFTRRLFKTNRVCLLVQTIKDCLVTAVSLQNESNLGLSELELQNRLLQQLTTACNELNDIFSLPVPDRMAIISDDRDKKKRESRRTHTPLPLSDATRRSLQRKLTSTLPTRVRQPYRKRCKSASSVRSATSNESTPPSQRRPLTASFSYKYSAPQSNRKPWR